MEAILLELVEEVYRSFGLGHEDGLADELGEVERVAADERGQEVFDGEVADDLVELPAVDGDAGVACAGDGLAERGGADANLNGDDVALGDHDVPGGEVSEGEGTGGKVGDPLVDGVVRGLFDEVLELFAGVSALGKVGGVAEGPEDDVGGGRQEPDEGREGSAQKEEEGPDEEGVPLGGSERERLRDQLAEDKREEGEARDHDSERDRCGQLGIHDPEARDVDGDIIRDGGTSVGCGAAGDDGEGNLDGGEEPLGVLAERLDGAGGGAALLGEFTEPRLPDVEHRDLGACKNAVSESQYHQDQQLL